MSTPPIISTLRLRVCADGAEGAMPNFCAQCGTKQTATDKFCANCGGPGGAAVPAPSAPPYNPAAPPPYNPAASLPPYNKMGGPAVRAVCVSPVCVSSVSSCAARAPPPSVLTDLQRAGPGHGHATSAVRRRYAGCRRWCGSGPDNTRRWHRDAHGPGLPGTDAQQYSLQTLTSRCTRALTIENVSQGQSYARPTEPGQMPICRGCGLGFRV